MTENPNRAARIVGFVGLVVIVLSLTSARLRLPGRPVGLSSALTPLIGLELPHSKADVESLLGPPASENRKVIANRSVGFGYDFVAGWLLFLFALYKLSSAVRPDLHGLRLITLVLLSATGFLTYAVVARTVQAANESVLTDKMFDTLKVLGWLKWHGVFAGTLFCSTLLRETPRVLRFGGELLCLSSIIGMFAVAYQTSLVGPMVAVMFGALCGISTLLIIKPQLFYELQGSKPSAGVTRPLSPDR
jgi:hypothetical protein